MHLQFPKRRNHLNKWYFSFSVGDDFQTMWPLMKILNLAFFKPTVLPSEGATFRRGEYKGFIFTCRFVVPFQVTRWR